MSDPLRGIQRTGPAGMVTELLVVARVAHRRPHSNAGLAAVGMDDTDLRDERPARRGAAATAVTTGGHRERRRYERGAL